MIIKSLLLCVALLAFYHCQSTRETSYTVQEKIVTKSIKVSDVWSGHPVGFDILTIGDRQYVAYYDDNRNMCIAQRGLDQVNWQTKILPSQVGWDSHNSVVMALDREGYLHVSGNMHGDPLIYFRSRKPNDISDFDQLDMVGSEEDRVTYPVFFTNSSDDLFFQYRDGGSGNGITYINRYDAKARKWSRALNQGLFDGEEETNAYPTGPVQGPDGFFHYMWVWRLNPIANTNHNLSYVRTRDFVHFENIEGEAISIPIKYRERKVIADPVGPWNGLMNSSKRLAFDTKNRPVFGYHKFDSEGHSQLFICRYESNNWVINQVSDWPDYTWEINKRGSLGSAIALKDIKTDGKGNILFEYKHAKYGSGILQIDEERLELKKDIKNTGLWEIEEMPSDVIPGMQINQKIDNTGKYILKWQTLSSNFDKPRDPPYPDPSELILYELQDVR
ncbi:MAG: hypothetical protein HKN76_17990 [Saprospiraceae bacterium]|nr:hypothetical protein [Saprospiraceae bacterium]